MCDEWRDSFEAFFEWSQNNGYQDCTRLDRIDKRKGYYPENCRFITKEKDIQGEVNHLNNVIIEGNACRDAVLKITDSGSAICKMSIAVNRFYKSGDGFEKDVSFFDVDAFGEVAKLCGQKVKKGDEVRIVDRLK